MAVSGNIGFPSYLLVNNLLIKMNFEMLFKCLMLLSFIPKLFRPLKWHCMRNNVPNNILMITRKGTTSGLNVCMLQWFSYIREQFSFTHSHDSTCYYQLSSNISNASHDYLLYRNNAGTTLINALCRAISEMMSF